MTKASVMQTSIDISKELASKNYEKVIGYANDAQEELIYKWQIKDKTALEHLILVGRNILNFWMDSIIKKRLWVALVRCGAWLGTMETIQKLTYEESMDQWSARRLSKKISSIKNLPEILQLLEVKGVMTHSEIVEKMHFNHPSTLTEIMKKVAGLNIIDIRKSGKYSLYSLSDAGVRYAKQMREKGGQQVLLQNIIQEYDLQMDVASFAAHLRSMKDGMFIKPGQALALKTDNEKAQNFKVENIFKTVSYDKTVENLIVLKTQKSVEGERFVRTENSGSTKILKAVSKSKSAKYEMGA